MKHKILSVLFILVVSQGYSQNSDFQIKYNFNAKSESEGEGKRLDQNSIPAPSSGEYTIVLQANGSFSTSLGKGKKTRYDLDKELVSKFSQDTVYSSTPLYSIIDYRLAEYKNRAFLTGMLEAGGVQDAFGDLANLESIFGIEDKNQHIMELDQFLL